MTLAQKAIALDGALPYGYELLGSVHVLKKQYEEAIAAGEWAVTLDPACARCYVTLAEILIFVGRARKACV